MLASRRREPTSSTSPPTRAGSTAREARTWRPDALPMRSTSWSKSSCGQLDCGGELDVEDALLAGDEGLELARDLGRPRRSGPSRRAAAGSCARARRRRRAPARAARPSRASRARGFRARTSARAPARPWRRSRRAPPARARAGRPPSRPRTARARTCGARPPSVAAALEDGEVEVADRLVDQAAVVGVVEHLAGHAAVAITVSSATSARSCSSARRVSASTCLRVSSSRRWRSASSSSRRRSRCASPIRRASLRISSRLAPGLVHQRAMLLEQAAGLVAGPVGLVERVADPLAALVDDALDRAEGVLASARRT